MSGFAYTATPRTTGTTITAAIWNTHETALAAAADHSQITLTRAAVDPTGTVDAAPILQAAIDALAAGTDDVVITLPKGVYLLDSAIFLDDTTAESMYVIDFQGSRVNLGPNLPTVAGFETAGATFAIFANTLRSALSAGVVTVNDATRATGSGGSLRTVIIRNARISGQNAARSLLYFNRGAVTLDHVILDDGLHALSGYDYTDGVTLINPYSRGSGYAGQIYYRQTGQGDGLLILGGKSDSPVRMAKLTTCRGAVILGQVTAGFEFINCSGINVIGAHQEGQQSTMTSLVIKNSVVKLDGTIVYENWSSTVAPITIDDSGGEAATDLTLDDCQTVQLHTTSTGGTEFSPLINVVSADENTKVTARNLTGRFASSAMSGKHPEGAQPYVTGAAAIVTAATSAAGRAALATGNWQLRRKATGTWSLTPGQILVARAEPSAPSIAQITTSTGVNSGGTLANGTAYQYACAVIDAAGNYGQVSATSSATATANGATRILLNLPNSPSTVIVWRDAGTSVLSAPDAYCVLPIRAARPYLYDTGDYLMGRPWVTTSVPVPNTVAATNHTADSITVA